MKTILPKIFKKSIFSSFFQITLFSLVALFLFALPVLAVETNTISAYPTHPSDTDPRSKSWFIYSIPAGDSKNDSVTVVNNGTEPVTLKVYPADSTKTKEGGFALTNIDAVNTDIGSYIKLETSEITLAPKEVKKINFVITMPENATKGEHSGGIVFENTTPRKVKTNKMNVNVISRVGVRIYETVPGDEQLSMNVSDLKYSVVNDYLSFTFKLQNTGTVHVTPKGMLELKDMVGRVVERIPLDNLIGTVVPGEPVSVKVPTHVLSPVLGWNSATVAVYYSPTKVALATTTFMPNKWGAFIFVFIVLLIVVSFTAKNLLVHKKAHSRKVTLAPHIQLIVGGILLGIIVVSGLIALYLNSYFGG